MAKKFESLQQETILVSAGWGVREWLTLKFGESIISCFTVRPWPAKSPILSPLDNWFWSVCLVELGKNLPNSLPELVNTVERYAASLNNYQIITAANEILHRACIESDGRAIEYKLESFKKDLIFNLLLRIFFLICPTLGNTNNIMRTI